MWMLILLCVMCQVLAQNHNNGENSILKPKFEKQKERLLTLHNNARRRLRRGKVPGQPRAPHLKKLVR